ncbi:MAG: HPr family phosphocarrier protein [Suipraeoptans sp.]
MLKFDYVITDSIGMHARPAGLLVKEAGKYESEVKISLREKVADAKKLFALMQLGIKHGDVVCITVDGNDEATACTNIKTFFESNL